MDVSFWLFLGSGICVFWSIGILIRNSITKFETLLLEAYESGKILATLSLSLLLLVGGLCLRLTPPLLFIGGGIDGVLFLIFLKLVRLYWPIWPFR